VTIFYQLLVSEIDFINTFSGPAISSSLLMISLFKEAHLKVTKGTTIYLDDCNY